MDIALLLGEALKHDYGLVVSVSNVETFKRQAYAVRSKLINSGLREFESISFRTSPYDPLNEIWIVKYARSADGT